jgi:hypothetical protein
MITQLLAPLPIAHSLLSPTLPEVAALALVLLITLAMALVWAPTYRAHSLTPALNSPLASKLQDLAMPGRMNLLRRI